MTRTRVWGSLKISASWERTTNGIWAPTQTVDPAVAHVGDAGVGLHRHVLDRRAA